MGKNEMNKFFYGDDVLVNYEHNGEWEKSVEHLRNIWLNNSQEKSVLLRLAAQCWYVLTFWDCDIPKENLVQDIFKKNFQMVYENVVKNWNTDADCLLIFGYFMCVNQFCFDFLDEDIMSIEKKGSLWISEAYLINSENILAKLMYLMEKKNALKCKLYKRKIRKQIQVIFGGNSLVEHYFLEICT